MTYEWKRGLLVGDAESFSALDGGEYVYAKVKKNVNNRSTPSDIYGAFASICLTLESEHTHTRKAENTEQDRQRTNKKK